MPSHHHPSSMYTNQGRAAAAAITAGGGGGGGGQSLSAAEDLRQRLMIRCIKVSLPSSSFVIHHLHVLSLSLSQPWLLHHCNYYHCTDNDGDYVWMIMYNVWSTWWMHDDDVCMMMMNEWWLNCTCITDSWSAWSTIRRDLLSYPSGNLTYRQTYITYLSSIYLPTHVYFISPHTHLSLYIASDWRKRKSRTAIPWNQRSSFSFPIYHILIIIN